MKKLSLEYKRLFKDKRYKKSLLIGIILLALAGIISSIIIGYSDRIQGSALEDLIIDNIPQFQLLWFRTFGIALITISVIIFGLIKPKYIPTLSKTIGLMYIIRAFFIGMTALNQPAEKITLVEHYPFLNPLLNQGNDLFFSGHVAFPFLAALIFWDNKKIRYWLLFASIISGAVSLFAKTHYSIDVFAAPLITYSIFKISEKIFKKDFNYIKVNRKNKI